MNDRLKLGSLFDGIGGFPLAASRLGIVPVWASEIVAAPIAITRRHFPGMKHLGDIMRINGADIEPVDIVTFGSPCQDLSVAGKRAGLAGARSGLFGEAIRIIDEMRKATDGKYPTWAVWENVPGALSSNDGLDFRAVLQAFADAGVPMPPSGRWAGAGMVRGGRCDVAWRILDAQFWGVPQRRRRVFVVADFGGKRAAAVLFKPEGLRGHIAAGGAAREGFAGCAGGGPASANDGGAGRRARGESDAANECIAVWPDIARTLAARHDSSPCVDRGQNVVVSAFGESGPGYWRDGVQTLRARSDRPSWPSQVVCYDARGNGDGRVVNTLTGDHQSRITDYTAIVAAAFMGGQGAKAGGLGYQEELAPTLKSAMSGGNTVPTVVYACRTDQTGSNGLGVSENVGYTLDGAVGQAVAIDCRNHSVGTVSGTLQSKTNGGHSLNFVNPVCVAHGQGGAEICGDLSPTLNCNHEQPYIAGGQYQVRRLTPVECERLQGFPDGWTEYGVSPDQYAQSLERGAKRTGLPEEALLSKISDSKRYAAIGNSVAIPCVSYIMEGIAEQSCGGAL